MNQNEDDDITEIESDIQEPDLPPPPISLLPQFRDLVDASGLRDVVPGLMTDEPLLLMQYYVQLMWAWNERLNMTRHTTWELFVQRDLRDVIYLASVIQPGEDVLDLGSGGGVPGIPLSILRPDVNVSLAESVGKRAAVLSHMVQELQLPVPVYAARGEEILDDIRFTAVVSRAVGSLHKLCTWVAPHWINVDRMLLIKGPKWVEERAEARHRGTLGTLTLRKIVSYGLTPGDATVVDEDAALVGERDGAPGEGVILQVWPKDRKLPYGDWRLT
ncbi:MAG: 16S rRNA (guanine(527)-N(7))-methyltransferase RsmG [Planctomycetota bacterium]